MPRDRDLRAKARGGGGRGKEERKTRAVNASEPVASLRRPPPPYNRARSRRADADCVVTRWSAGKRDRDCGRGELSLKPLAPSGLPRFWHTGCLHVQCCATL
jgi:hypothetical protein